MKAKILLLILIPLFCQLVRGQTNTPPATNAVSTSDLLSPFIILVPASGEQVASPPEVQTVSLRRHTPYYYGNGYRGGYSVYSGFGGFGTGPTYVRRSNGALVLQGSRGTSTITPSTAPGPNWGQLRNGAPVLRSQNRSYPMAPPSGQGPVVGRRQSGAPVLRGNR